jgi:hypothetical protein
MSRNVQLFLNPNVQQLMNKNVPWLTINNAEQLQRKNVPQLMKNNVQPSWINNVQRLIERWKIKNVGRNLKNNVTQPIKWYAIIQERRVDGILRWKNQENPVGPIDGRGHHCFSIYLKENQSPPAGLIIKDIAPHHRNNINPERPKIVEKCPKK